MARFTRGELEVMHLLWQHGEMKPAEIQERFPRPIQNAAVRSLLRILLKKRHVTRRKVGKAYYYKARTRKDRAFRTMLRQLVDVFCEGSTDALFVRLVRSENLSKRDLLKIKQLADDMESPRDD